MIVFDKAGKAFRNRKGVYKWVFRDLNLTLSDKVSTGILAPRGQGKSTLIDLAAGNITPSEGRVQRLGRVSWPFGMKSNISNRLTGRQNIRFLTDVYGRNFSDVYDFVAEFSELGKSLDTQLSRYNGEMRGRLMASTLYGMDFDYILVDDAMDGGDASFRIKCNEYIERNKDRIKFLVASSNPQVVSKYCQVAGVLNEGKLTFYDTVQDAVGEFDKINQVFV